MSTAVDVPESLDDVLGGFAFADPTFTSLVPAAPETIEEQAKEEAKIAAEAAASIAAAAKYGARPFPLLDGGCVHLSIGADATGIVVAYCDESVRRFIELHRPVTIANQLIGDLSIPPPSLDDPSTFDVLFRRTLPPSLSTIERTIDAMVDLTCASETGVARTRVWLDGLVAAINIRISALNGKKYQSRFRAAVYEWLFGEPAATARAATNAASPDSSIPIALHSSHVAAAAAAESEGAVLAARQLIPLRPALDDSVKRGLLDSLSRAAFHVPSDDFSGARTGGQSYGGSANCEVKFGVTFAGGLEPIDIEAGAVTTRTSSGRATTGRVQVVARRRDGWGLETAPLFSKSGLSCTIRDDAMQIWLQTTEKDADDQSGVDPLFSSLTPYQWVVIWTLAVCCTPLHTPPWREATDELIARLQTGKPFESEANFSVGEAVGIAPMAGFEWNFAAAAAPPPPPTTTTGDFVTPELSFQFSASE